MRRVAYMVAGLVMAMAVAQGPAAARFGNEWCAEDPVFQLLGRRVELTTFVHSPAAAVSNITYNVEVPSNAGTVRVTYPGGRRIPTTVSVSYTGAEYSGDSFSVQVSVTVTGPVDRETVIYVSGKGVTSATHTGWTNTDQTFEIDVTTR
jgi:hypothetical protein